MPNRKVTEFFRMEGEGHSQGGPAPKKPRTGSTPSMPTQQPPAAAAAAAAATAAPEAAKRDGRGKDATAAASSCHAASSPATAVDAAASAAHAATPDPGAMVAGPAPAPAPAPVLASTSGRLDLGNGCWIEQGRLPPELRALARGAAFDVLWALHPVQRGKVKIAGSEVEIPRWHQPYMRGYRFSGMNHPGLPLPDALRPFLDSSNTLECVQPYPGGFNAVLVNWYGDGNDYMGAHADDERELVAGAPILSISLGQERILRFTSKVAGSDFKKDLPMPDCSWLVMGGNTQKHFKHAVPKVSGKKGAALGRRINITFRVFK